MKKTIKSIIIIIFVFVIITIFIVTFFHINSSDYFNKHDIAMFPNQYLDYIEFNNFNYTGNKLSLCFYSLDEKDHILDSKYEIKSNDETIYTFNDTKVSKIENCLSIDLNNKYYELYLYNNETENSSQMINDTKIESVDYCINNDKYDSTQSEILNNKLDTLTEFVSDYRVSVIYEDLSSNFSFSYKPDTVYYGASLIKLPEALYLYDEAINGNIDLNSTITLDSSYYHYGGKDIKSNGINSQVSYDNLIKYMLETTDNAAHLMLFDNVTKESLADYEKALGAKYVYNKSDKFGNQTASSMIVYLKHAYELIMKNNKYGSKLYEYMTNDYTNYLYLDDDIKVAHKYGYVNTNFHDVGIVFNERPYVIAILTSYDLSPGGDIVNNISKRVKDLHEAYYSEKKISCLSKTFIN